MKIAFVSDAVYPFNKGGKEMRIYQLTKALVAQGCQVDVYTMRWWAGGDTYEHEGVTYHAISRLYPLYHGERRSIKQGVLFGLATLRMVKYDFDVLEVDSMPFFPLYAAKFVSLVRRRPFFATWHEVWGREYWQEYLKGVKGTIAYQVERYSVLMPNHIVTVSEHTTERLRTMLRYHAPVSTIPNGIDYKMIQPIRANKHVSDVIYTGRLLAHKNVNLLIDAMVIICKQRPKTRCYIVGGGPEQAALQQQVERLGLTKNVTLTGYLETSEEVFAYMKASRVFVSPSTREGFGITVLEAYACGLSIVTVNHRDNAAQYVAPKDRSIVCEPNAADIARAIQLQLQQPTQTVSHKVAAHYDWDKLASKLKEVYTS